jgi:methylase of polypeptide subunit release factors
LDLQHGLFALTFKEKLCHSPINVKKLHRVLNVNTGTGIWAINFANKAPLAKVIGVDLSSIGPNFVPLNFEYQINDLELE